MSERPNLLGRLAPLTTREKTIGELIFDDPLTTAQKAIVDALMAAHPQKPNKKIRGRPPKQPLKHVDVQRAQIIVDAAKVIDKKRTVRGWIQAFQNFEREANKPRSMRVFPGEQNLESSVSRGFSRLGIEKSWRRRNLRKNT
jgi:hypothetical protein